MLGMSKVYNLCNSTEGQLDRNTLLLESNTSHVTRTLQLALLAINSFKCYRVLCVGQTYLLKVQPSMKDIKTSERKNLFAVGQIATLNV